jgi:hypothetical protein
MKKLFLSAIIITTLFACKKEDNDDPQDPGPTTPVDYRDAVVGNYVGTKNNYFWMMGMPPTSSDTTYAWSFTVVKDTTDSSIVADGYVFKIDSTLRCYESQVPGPTIRSFDFRNDSAIIYFRSGGLGGYGTMTIKGLKQ